jgi:hypothetical protein
MPLLINALIPNSSLRPSVINGAGAIKRKDSQLFSVPGKQMISDSLDLDKAVELQYPNDNRWDYLFSLRTLNKLVAVEPHTAKDDQISVVIEKKKKALIHIRGHFHPQHNIANWIWIPSKKVSFSRMENARRRLDKHGIEFNGNTPISFV